jgi:hypothetical protein
MQRKTEEQMALIERLRVARALIRLKHSNYAYRELNDVLPAIEADHVAAIQGGTLKVLKADWADIVEAEHVD